jgi:hypothetical protein
MVFSTFPELTYLETKFATLVSYGLTLELLQEVLVSIIG